MGFFLCFYSTEALRCKPSNKNTTYLQENITIIQLVQVLVIYTLMFCYENELRVNALLM